MENRIKLGVSACLLGKNVRYDGGHRLDCFIRHTLGKFVNFVPVCPEVECGMPVPRETIQLENNPESPRLVATRSRKDMTKQMLDWATGRVRELESEGLCGYIFKSGSPSCGIIEVKVHNGNGMPLKKGVGLFARAFMEHFPLLPTEDEKRLGDAWLRESFVESIFAIEAENRVQPAQRSRMDRLTWEEAL